MTVSLVATLAALAMAEGSTMAFEALRCEEADSQKIASGISSEVEARGLETEVIHLLVTCGDLASIEAFRELDGARALREVDLRQVPQAARARVMALAAVELIASVRPPPPPGSLRQSNNSLGWSEPIDPADKPEATIRKRTARKTSSRWHIGALSLLEHFQGLVGWSSGLGVELGWHRNRWGGLVSLAGHSLSREVTLGEGQAEGGRVEAWVLHRRGSERLALVGGAGIRLALSRFTGSPALMGDKGKQFWGGWGGPTAGLGIELKATRTWFAQLRYEAGYAVISSVGTDGADRDLGFSGLWHGPRLVVGLASGNP